MSSIMMPIMIGVTNNIGKLSPNALAIIVSPSVWNRIGI